MATITKVDEKLKAGIHGIVLGIILIPLFYNIMIKKWGNVAIYTSLIGFELYHITEHMKEHKLLENSSCRIS